MSLQSRFYSRSVTGCCLVALALGCAGADDAGSRAPAELGAGMGVPGGGGSASSDGAEASDGPATAAGVPPQDRGGNSSGLGGVEPAASVPSNPGQADNGAPGGGASTAGGGSSMPASGGAGATQPSETDATPPASDAGAGGEGEVAGCDPGTSGSSFATDCPTTASPCVEGSWVAAGPETGAPLRAESEHFAAYYPEGTNMTPADAELALETLEEIWTEYFGPPVLLPEPYCERATKYKASVHFDNEFPLWGGAWGDGYMGMWIGPSAARDRWGLAHEFAHGVQSVSGGLSCGGAMTSNTCGWIFESHANYLPHQLAWFADDVHCSEMLVNAPHLYLGSTRNRYCNWQFMEYLENTQCHQAVHDIWTGSPPKSDPFVAIRDGRGWTQRELNDFIGDWAMHNVTWDYRDSAEAFRRTYGPLTDASRPERRNRITRLNPLDENFPATRRFQSPYYAAPQRYGYNVVRLVPEAGASEVHIKFRGVVQPEANSDWRWGIVATDAELTRSRYSALQRGADSELRFCLQPDELLWLVVAATPSEHQSIYWDQPYASIYRYPYLVEVHGAWPDGYRDGVKDACPIGTVVHPNGGGCALPTLPESVYVGPHAMVLGGEVSGDARIEDQAIILDGATVSGGTVGGLTVLNRFTVSGDATVRATFYPPGYFEPGQGLSGTAVLLGDVEYRGASLNRDAGSFSGFVDAQTANMSLDEVTVAPPYSFRD